MKFCIVIMISKSQTRFFAGFIGFIQDFDEDLISSIVLMECWHKQDIPHLLRQLRQRALHIIPQISTFPMLIGLPSAPTAFSFPEAF
jgi:hypothetical protein